MEIEGMTFFVKKYQIKILNDGECVFTTVSDNDLNLGIASFKIKFVADKRDVHTSRYWRI